MEKKKRGRPSKGELVSLHCQVHPEVKQWLVQKASELKISQGELISRLVHFVRGNSRFIHIQERSKVDDCGRKS